MLKQTLEGFQAGGSGVEKESSSRIEIRSIQNTQQRDMYKQLSQSRLNLHNTLMAKGIASMSNNSRQSCKLISQGKKSDTYVQPIS